MEIQKLAYFIQFCEDEDYVKKYRLEIDELNGRKTNRKIENKESGN